MILADTSVWVEHFRATDRRLFRLLDEQGIVLHEMVIGELACGGLPERARTIGRLKRMPRVRTCGAESCLDLIEVEGLVSRGIGWVDVHLLASCLRDGVRLWTRDRRLHEVARGLGLG
ncbi:MAG: PIN domain-containing protein [Phycisphaeraceae bacterium]